jgi:phage baseplate assembly protein W
VSDIAFPFAIDQTGRTAAADAAEHVRDLIEQVLFTSPGERVNRPTFGSGLLQLVFAPNSVELASALQFSVQGALQQWLGGLISVESVDVSIDDATLSVGVRYSVKGQAAPVTAQFSRGV